METVLYTNHGQNGTELLYEFKAFRWSRKFWSMDGDPPAAMRYTEIRLGKVASTLLDDIDKETVNFIENYDNSLKEPSVLPAKYPNLLVNGAGGIAVGMATNIPPHNLGEIIDATILLLNNPKAEDSEIKECI